MRATSLKLTLYIALSNTPSFPQADKREAEQKPDSSRSCTLALEAVQNAAYTVAPEFAADISLRLLEEERARSKNEIVTLLESVEKLASSAQEPVPQTPGGSIRFSSVAGAIYQGFRTSIDQVSLRTRMMKLAAKEVPSRLNQYTSGMPIPDYSISKTCADTLVYDPAPYFEAAKLLFRSAFLRASLRGAYQLSADRLRPFGGDPLLWATASGKRGSGAADPAAEAFSSQLPSKH